MTDLTAYEERQEDEVEFLQAVFSNPGDFQDLRQHDSWKVSCVSISSNQQSERWVEFAREASNFNSLLDC